MAAMQGSAGIAARRAAVGLLDQVLGEARLLSEAVADPHGPLAPCDPQDRARAQRLALTTLRHVERADRLLDPHLRKAPPRTVRNILRLAVVEIMVDGAAAHGVVNAAVDIARHGRKTGPLAGLVNAVLRKLAETPSATWEKMPPQRMPMWLRKPLVGRYGRDAVSAVEAVQMVPPPLDLTPKNPADMEALAAALEAEILPTGSLRRRVAGQVSDLPGYGEGDWWVQDAAAALPARLLAPEPGDRVLDLCAAPGGKTLQLAAAGAKVTALDLSGPRMARLNENLARCRLSAETIVADALNWTAEAPYDSILLDAPCSASGTIRRHPDLPFVKDGSELAGLVTLQAAMIDRALTHLRPGGALVFCTCSLLPEEGELQALSALERHAGLAIEPTEIAGTDPDWRSPEGGLRLRPDFWPDRGGMDGFYMVRFRRAG